MTSRQIRDSFCFDFVSLVVFSMSLLMLICVEALEVNEAILLMMDTKKSGMAGGEINDRQRALGNAIQGSHGGCREGSHVAPS
jgi:hypothetical protein